MSLSEKAQREMRRELEKDYSMLVNMRAARETLILEIEATRKRLDALNVLIAAYGTPEANDQPVADEG